MMKKLYNTPEFEVVEVEVKEDLLFGSGDGNFTTDGDGDGWTDIWG